VVDLNAGGLFSALGAAATLGRRWRQEPPDVVHGWMPHGNLLSLMASRAAGRPVPVLWSLHMSLDPATTKAATRLLVRAGGVFSGRGPARVVATSEAAAAAHRRWGYAAGTMVTIPNGVDPSAFKPDPAARAAVRRELGLAEGQALAVCACRWDPMKDPLNLVSAAARWDGGTPIKVAFAGPGMDDKNTVLMAAVRRAGAKRFLLLGERRDMPRLWAAADAAVCPSRTESFPLTVVEAMACGTPCAATDVGDVRRVVGDTGLIVPPSDPAVLAEAVKRLALSAEREALGRKARERVTAEYSLERAAERYHALYRSTAGITS
jgi:glycosyltransferase involved in cell wall biosynthesis